MQPCPQATDHSASFHNSVCAPHFHAILWYCGADCSAVVVVHVVVLVDIVAAEELVVFLFPVSPCVFAPFSLALIVHEFSEAVWCDILVV